MAIEVKINNVSIQYPQIGDTEWGNNATNFAIQTATAFNAIGLSDGTTVDLPGTLDVTGNTTLDANLSVGGTTSLTGNLAVGGTTSLTGNVAINTDKFNVTASTGNTTIAGTLGISNGTALAPAITPSGDTNTGLYSVGADKIGFAANGVRQGEFGVGYGGFTGNIIQVVSGELTTRATTISTTFVNTGLSATITPRYTTSKILVLVNLTIGPGNAALIQWNLLRESTNIAQSTGATNNATGGAYSESGANAANVPIGTSTSFLDSPSTISATTYKVQFRSSNGGTVSVAGRAAANDYGGYCSIILLEVQQ